METTIKVKAIDQELTFIESPFVASGNIETIAIQFEFDEMWDGFTKTAVFYRDINDPYRNVLKNDQCYVRPEVMKTDGRMYLGVFGVKDNKVKTSKIVFYDIGVGVPTTGTIEYPDEEIWQQILDELGNIRELAKQIQQEQTDFTNRIEQDQEDYQAHMEQVFREYYEELKTISANFMSLEDVDRICGGTYDPIYDDYNVEAFTKEELEKILV